jgi:rhamnose transport system ATP-binding protein
MAPGDTPLIEARGIAKSFGGVEVLHGVDLALAGGEVHALLGENGAGKSTFARILAGVFRPSRGEIRLGGQTVELASPLDAQRRGIVLLHQEPISFPDLSVAENLSIGRRREGPLARVRWGSMVEEARALMATLGVAIDVTRPMRGLSIADQQMVEIARAVAGDSRVIIMDEPTAALTPREVETLFTMVRRLKADGRALVFISHRLEEVRAIADRVTVFRDGARIATEPTADLTDDDIIRLMIGRPLREFLHRDVAGAASVAEPGEVALAVSGLSLPGRFADITFEIRRGEILGIGGLVGAGRTDVARAIFGIAPAAAGSIEIGGAKVTIASPRDAIRHRLAYVPEDRAIAGIFRTLASAVNITAAAPKRFAPGGIIRHGVERALAGQAVDRLKIRLASIRQPVGELSGGNQQKTILARWLLTDPDILILDEPTRGIDIGVKAEFYTIINALAAEGKAILLISSELPELLALSDRILVMCEGRITARLGREEADQATIMAAAVPGGRREAAA